MKKDFCFLAMVIGALLAVASPASADLISEFQPNAAGTDPDPASVELSGTPNAAFDLWLLSIESDGFNGTVDRAANVTGTYDSLGLAVVSVPDLENPSFTYVLTDGFTGTAGTTDIDPNDNGTGLDLSTFGTIMDAIGIPDIVADASTQYGALLGFSDFSYTGDEPGLVFRDASTGAWYAINEPDTGEVFDLSATDVVLSGTFDSTPTLAGTFGSINPTFTAAIPEPSSRALLGLAGLGLITRRRR